MAALRIMNLPIRNLVKDKLTLEISLQGVKSFRMRLWLGMKALKLAAWVIGCGIRIDPVVKEI